MSRRRYVYREVSPGKIEAIEVGADYTDAPRPAAYATEETIYGKLQATDGTDLSTRKRHRDYMRRTGSALASDFTETWAKARAERERPPMTSAKDDAARDHAMREAIEQLRHRRG